jgi:lipoate-protein ligase A
MGTRVEESWRLVLTPPLGGPENMAIDEAILSAVGSGDSPPTLRLYAWAPPCLSLGYSQEGGDVDLDRLDDRGWDIVRRLTGGKAILHTDELTYSISAPAGNPHFSGDILESYRHLSRGLTAGLALLGLHPQVEGEVSLTEADRANPVCFEVPSSYEITIEGKKLVGSAQVRRKGRMLQHGSIPLYGDISLICQVLPFNDPPSRSQACERVRDRATTLADALGRIVSWEEAAEAIARGFADGLGWELESGSLSPQESERARSLTAEKYADPEWTFRV